MKEVYHKKSSQETLSLSLKVEQPNAARRCLTYPTSVLKMWTEVCNKN